MRDTIFMLHFNFSEARVIASRTRIDRIGDDEKITLTILVLMIEARSRSVSTRSRSAHLKHRLKKVLALDTRHGLKIEASVTSHSRVLIKMSKQMNANHEAFAPEQ